ncbi:MAG TPA: hypothetical protein VLA19_22830 [Herpetosiphonaceae bacterium]|nr:hypothetical protein [Herpetosiphonaceae bacterium]
MAVSHADDLGTQARFIFRGTIARLRATTMPAVAVTDSTAVVRVEEVLQAPDALGDPKGQEITVELSALPQAQEGQRAIFFTDPWLYGESLAVREWERRVDWGDDASLRRQIADAAERQQDDALRRRLAMAVAVVAGRVYNNRPAAVYTAQRVSEHDPQWWEALIAVDVVVKGQISAPTVTVLFANSMDIVWFRAPKLRVGQDGVWLLHHEPVPGASVVTLAIGDSLDAQPRDQLDRIRRLLGVSS